jgi:hypothetical protein
MALHDRLMQNLMAKLPGATEALLHAELFNTIDEACREGWLWRETISVPLVEGNDTYTLAPAGTEVVYVFSIAPEEDTVGGVLYEYGKLTVVDLPTAEEEGMKVYAVVALTPSHDVDTENVEGWIPGDMWSEHYQMFMSGVMHRMTAQPAKPYTNPQLAVFYGRKFRSDLAYARRKVDTGGVPGAQRWRFPRWA